MTLNVDPNNNDPFYRYKLHKPSIIIEGKNQNSRTLINNIDQLASDLEVKPEQLLKFISLKKGTRCSYAKEKSMVKTILTHNEVLEFIYDFIKKDVLCKKCANPETVRSIKNNILMIKCKSCGFISENTATKDDSKIFGK